MFDAQTILATSAGANYILGPWFEREADAFICIAEVLSIAGGATQLKIEVWHKNREDIGDGVVLAPPGGSTITMTSVGRWSPVTWSGLYELVRFKFTLTTSDIGWAMLRVLPVSWFDTVKP